MAGRRHYRLLYRHVAREYLLSFVVAFFFFFFIFFINQILLLAQKILIKQVDYLSLLLLVLLSVPQFLLYTLPFSSLTASSMVIGDMAANHEILALRSSGIAVSRIFIIITLVSLFFSGMTFVTADKLLPYSSDRYRDLYTSLMREVPTLEIRDNATNTIGNRTMSNKDVDGSTIYDIVLMEEGGSRSGQIVTAPRAEVRLDEAAPFTYLLDLENPVILKSRSDDTWMLFSSEQARLALDLGSQMANLVTALPSQLSIRELRALVAEQRLVLDRDEANHRQKIEALVEKIERAEVDATRLTALEEDLERLQKERPINFYYQYYRAELSKKYALSAACTILVALTFSLSFFRIKHGRLVGFGLSMLASVAYWYLLFFAQLQVFSYPIDPAIFIWAPNIIMVVVSSILLLFSRRA